MDDNNNMVTNMSFIKISSNLYKGMYSTYLQVIKLLLMKVDEHMKSNISFARNETDGRNSDSIRLWNWALQYECPVLFEVV